MLPAHVEVKAVVSELVALTAMQQPILRPPAVPLIAHDPYFSIWSFTDNLADDWPRHWTGTINGMCGMVRIGDRAYRWMGLGLTNVPAMRQIGLQVLPTRTIYTFEEDGVRLTVEFQSPIVADSQLAISLPVSWITISAEAIDRDEKEVSIYFDMSAEATVDTSNQQVIWGRLSISGHHVMYFMSQEQNVLKKSGDNLRIDWGRLMIVGSSEFATNIGPAESQRKTFVESGPTSLPDDLDMPRSASDRWPVASLATRLLPGRPSAQIRIAYDDRFSIEYFHRALPPFWRVGVPDPLGRLLSETDGTVSGSSARSRAGIFDQNLLSRAREIGGERYAALCALAYRQTLAAHKLVKDFNGDLLMFSKENFSNGCIGTVDVTYPASPFFLYFDASLLEAQLRPILDYSLSPRWPFKFAPHDLGTYPKANGQVYGGGERSEANQMPVEECGNMLIMIAAMDILKNHAPFGGKYWQVLDQWADYLVTHGLDPGNQLCTDDFAGHLARNVNLAAKAIVALGAFSMHCERQGRPTQAIKYRNEAKRMAELWVEMANDGDHFRLAYDKPGTWSQKYNLIWDRVLGLNLFPQDVFDKEVAFYKTKIAKYGLPLDNRADYTKLDWCVWTACLSQNKGDFELFMEPIYRFVNETPDRVPLTDWFSTRDAKQMGFQARSVVGGVFMPFLIKEWK